MVLVGAERGRRRRTEERLGRCQSSSFIPRLPATEREPRPHGDSAVFGLCLFRFSFGCGRSFRDGVRIAGRAREKKRRDVGVAVFVRHVLSCLFAIVRHSKSGRLLFNKKWYVRLIYHESHGWSANRRSIGLDWIPSTSLFVTGDHRTVDSTSIQLAPSLLPLLMSLPTEIGAGSAAHIYAVFANIVFYTFS